MNDLGGVTRERCHGHRHRTVLAHRAGRRSLDRPRHEERWGRPPRHRISVRAGRTRAGTSRHAIGRFGPPAFASARRGGSMSSLLMLAAALVIVTASAALWVERRRPFGRRCFAALVSIAVTLSLFSVVAWAATAIVEVAPLYLTWAFVVTLALIFAFRLYRELQPPPAESR